MGIYVNGMQVSGGEPTGAAGGVLSGTYPDPNLDVPEAIDQLQLGDAAFDDIGTTAGTVASGTLGLTTNGDQIVRLAGAPSRVAIGTAGQAWRVNATPLPAWISPTFTCLAAELATTYAPTAVLQGLVAYTTDSDAAYVCTQTGVSTYAWKVIWYNREMPGGSPTAWWKLTEAVGSTTFADSGSAGATLTATTSGVGANVFPAVTSGPWGQNAVYLDQNSASPGAAYLESLTGVAEPSLPVTLCGWFAMRSSLVTGTFSRFVVKKYNAAFTSPFGTMILNVGPNLSQGLGALVVSGAATITSISRASLDTNGWQHVGLTYDGVTLRQYQNGRQTNTGAATGALDYGSGAGRTWAIGANPVSTTEQLNGAISDIRLYPVAQTAAWFLQCYQRGVGSWQG